MGKSADLYVRKGRPPTKKHPKCLTVLIWKENQSSVLSGAVARLDLLAGGGGGVGGQSRAPKAPAAWGVRGHAPPEDFEL